MDAFDVAAERLSSDGEMNGPKWRRWKGCRSPTYRHYWIESNYTSIWTACFLLLFWKAQKIDDFYRLKVWSAGLSAVIELRLNSNVGFTFYRTNISDYLSRLRFIADRIFQSQNHVNHETIEWACCTLDFAHTDTGSSSSSNSQSNSRVYLRYHSHKHFRLVHLVPYSRRLLDSFIKMIKCLQFTVLGASR